MAECYITEVVPYGWFLVTKRFLEAWLTPVGNENLDIGVAKHVLLRQPLVKHYVVRLPLHHIRLPFPQNFLLQWPKNLQNKTDASKQVLLSFYLLVMACFTPVAQTIKPMENT